MLRKLMDFCDWLIITSVSHQEVDINEVITLRYCPSTSLMLVYLTFHATALVVIVPL